MIGNRAQLLKSAMNVIKKWQTFLHGSVWNPPIALRLGNLLVYILIKPVFDILVILVSSLCSQALVEGRACMVHTVCACTRIYGTWPVNVSAQSHGEE